MFVNNEFEIVNTPEDFSKLIREYMGDEAEEYFNDLIERKIDGQTLEDATSIIEELSDYLKDIKREIE